jgi:hypothetical protein
MNKIENEVINEVGIIYCTDYNNSDYEDYNVKMHVFETE